MATLDPDLKPPPVDAESPDMGKPNRAPINDDASNEAYDPTTVDRKYWTDCLDDAERAEQDWRSRARRIIQIYRNETTSGRGGKWKPGEITFNILYANTEVMLPAVYQKPPEPVVRSRFTKASSPTAASAGLPPMGPPGGMVPPPPPGGPAPAPPMAAPTPPGLPSGTLPGGPEPTLVPPGMPLQVPADASVMIPPGEGMMIPPAPPPGMLGPMPPPPPGPGGRPPQPVIETAAAVMQKALTVVLDDEHSHDAVKMAIKDVLLPGRGVCRVRWKPQMKEFPVMAGDGATPLPNPETGEPQTEERKVWEEVGDEYVYWEDLLVDPVRAAADMNWIAFRHLFIREDLETEFAGSQQYEQLKTDNRLAELFKWTDESAAQSPVGGGGAMKTATKLGDKIKKAMVWEIWDRINRRIIWFCRETNGLVLRVDPDVLELDGFYPIPQPMLAVTTTDSRIPRPFYDLYARLADDLDETSSRISRLTKQIKVRGAYNAASRDVADILTADDQKMIPVDGVDMITGGLSNHIWIMPILDFMNALDKLFVAREQTKQAIYEVMGISDIMRGASKASETATAQRIKGNAGASRLEDAKEMVSDFVRDLLRLKADIIAKNFDAATLSAMTGENVTPEVMDVLRNDFMRMASIDIETDSTVIVDEQAEQQGMAMVMQSIQLVMQGAQGMLMSGILPPKQVVQLALELLKMALHPVRYSRGVVELINEFQQQLEIMAMMPPPPPPLPPPGAGPAGPGGPPGMPPGPPPGPPHGPPHGPNGVVPGPRVSQPPGRPPGAPPAPPGMM
jgi:hypothetical protein